MKLDVSMVRYLTPDDYRVLVGVEMGMRNHDLVPAELIATLSGLTSSTAVRSLSNIHKHKLVFHSRQKCDGYRLTYLGYDYLALRTLVVKGTITSVGRQIGVGKESDVYEVTNEEGRIMVLKIHRLGRISFRAIKDKRDYMGKRKNASWLYMSKLAAAREFSFMEALHKRDFPVPEPIDCNRHCIVMSMIEGTRLANIREFKNPDIVYDQLMNLIIRLTEYGLVHGDFNEFNILCDDEDNAYVIDFPQMVSTSHSNAAEQFGRDVGCIKSYFERKFKFLIDVTPQFEIDAEKHFALDVELSASGFDKESHSLFEGI